MKKVVIGGAGIFGASCARILAEAGYKVEVYEKEKKVGGMLYDYLPNGADFYVHKFGPHILNLDNEDVYKFINRFDTYISLDVKRKVLVGGKKLPLPINLDSIRLLLAKEEYEVVVSKLLDFFDTKEVTIKELLDTEIPEVQQLGQRIFENVYLGYNLKMWDLEPNEVNDDILKRMPIRLSNDDKLTKCKYQLIPNNGYTNLILSLLQHSNISLFTETNFLDRYQIEDGKVICDKQEIEDIVIFSGAVDELFGFRFGELSYRAIEFKEYKRNKNIDNEAAVITYPNNYKKTRSTDMQMLSGKNGSNTIIVSEYPGEYCRNGKMFGRPSYPVGKKTDEVIFNIYWEQVEQIHNLYIGGRLGEYKYYDMQATILSAMNIAKKIIADNE